MEYGNYSIKNFQLKNDFNNNNLINTKNNFEIEKYYWEQYHQYPYDCFFKANRF